MAAHTLESPNTSPAACAAAPRSRLGNRRLPFQPYSTEQLVAILDSRLGELADVIEPRARTYAARKVNSRAHARVCVCVCVCMCVHVCACE